MSDSDVKRQMSEEPAHFLFAPSCQGLMVEECGGGLYEELSVYAQPEGAEAPWE